MNFRQNSQDGVGRLGGRPWLMVALCLSSLILQPSAFSQVPLQFAYQGRLTNSNGVPVTGVVTADFAIIVGGDAYTGGTTGHLESAVPVTTDLSGVFSHVLGRPPTSVALSNLTDGATSRWIQVKIGPDVLTPRQQILAVPYSLSAPGVIPVGGVILWWGSTNSVPDGFEICNGTSPAPGSTLTGTKPDLRDKFVKGAVEADASVGDLNTGGKHTLNLSHNHAHAHTHEMNHYHGNGTLAARINIGGNTLYFDHYDVPDYVTGSFRTFNSGGVFTENVGFGIKVIGDSGTATRSDTSDANPINTGGALNANDLGSATDNRPAFQEMFYIIRVR